MSVFRALSILLYLLFPIVSMAVFILGGFWWTHIKDQTLTGREFLKATLMLIVFAVILYETGYKKFYRVGNKKYFYFVFVTPMVLTTIFFTYGVWRVYG